MFQLSKNSLTFTKIQINLQFPLPAAKNCSANFLHNQKEDEQVLLSTFAFSSELLNFFGWIFHTTLFWGRNINTQSRSQCLDITHPDLQKMVNVVPGIQNSR